MKLTYTGVPEEFPPRQQAKLDARLNRIAKMIEHGREREVRAVVRRQRHLHIVDLTLNAFDHALVGEASDRDLFTAMVEAADKLERQVQNMRARWRTTKRHKEAPKREPEAIAAAEAETVAPVKMNGTAKKAAARAAAALPKVVRVARRRTTKPMTPDEAVLEIGAEENFLVFQDADTDRMSVLVRRSDGHFDLVEGE
jgi:putative sigma-54 modulation protein